MDVLGTLTPSPLHLPPPHLHYYGISSDLMGTEELTKPYSHGSNSVFRITMPVWNALKLKDS